ncbi:MAG: hypothetical protein KTR27_16555 [Leptolyngbyaceae cyanobacterium MAG.088]|nr:hypothetical protein [Leptolyngbyaceae cyanobacterium MAG.088]
MVRIAELVNQFRRRMSEGQNFAQNPFQIVKQSVRKYGMLAYGKLSFSSSDNKTTNTNQPKPISESDTTTNLTEIANTNQHFQSGDASPNASLLPPTQLAETPQTFEQGLKLWQPTLQPGERLQGGWWGVYTIKSCMYAQDWIRCYDGLQDNGSEPVWIYEYCFDDDSWSDEEIDERKRRFKHLVDLNLRLGQGSDFRIIRPKDVINPAGNRAYFITRPLPQSITLGTFLEKQSIPWPRPKIERFLNQVLQSLQYLQTYLVNWPGDRWEQKLSHGNLSSDSLWLRFSESNTVLNESPFFVYLGRFPLWEHLFWPQQVPIAEHNEEIGSIQNDLNALAHITFALVRGYQSDEDPTDLNLWPNDSIRALYPYVLQLLGRGENGPFKSIDSAISSLQLIPDTYAPPEILEEPYKDIEEPEQTQALKLPMLPLLIGGGILFGLLTWLAWPKSSGKSIFAFCDNPCLLKDVANRSNEQAFRYDIESGSSWEKGSFRTLTSPLEVTNDYLTELHQTLQNRDPGFLLEKVHRAAVSRNLLIQYLRTDSLDSSLDAALVQQVDNFPDDIETQVVAHDGIAIFVTHANTRQRDSIPQRLNGRIRLEELREIFLNPDKTLANAKVQLYWPNDQTTANLLKDLLFDEQADKETFEQRRREGQRLVVKPEDQEPERMYEKMLWNFTSNVQNGKKDTIGIGFNRISQLVGQCSVYPLALVDNNGSHHLFVDAEGKPIDYATDLCGDKGTYWVNDRLFQSSPVTYPLAYEMAVVYHQPVGTEPCLPYHEGCERGQILADKLLTPEGQYLLSEIGLVPVLPIQKIRQMQWSPVAIGEKP